MVSFLSPQARQNFGVFIFTVIQLGDVRVFIYFSIINKGVRLPCSSSRVIMVIKAIFCGWNLKIHKALGDSPHQSLLVPKISI